jgi:hypothetical protein
VFLTPEDLLARVAPVADLVRTAIGEGHAHVSEVHRMLGVRPDAWFDSHIIRRVARERIEGEAKRLRSVGWGVDDGVASSGIHLYVSGSMIRVAKGTIDRVPCPGRSRRRREFWMQGALPLEDRRRPVRLDYLNLLLLWDIVGDVVELTVAVPSGVWPFGGRQKLLAAVPIEHDPFWFDAEFDAGDEDDDIGLFADVDEDDEDEAGGGENA